MHSHADSRATLRRSATTRPLPWCLPCAGRALHRVPAQHRPGPSPHRHVFSSPAHAEPSFSTLRSLAPTMLMRVIGEAATSSPCPVGAGRRRTRGRSCGHGPMLLDLFAKSLLRTCAGPVPIRVEHEAGVGPNRPISREVQRAEHPCHIRVLDCSEAPGEGLEPSTFGLQTGTTE